MTSQRLLHGDPESPEGPHGDAPATRALTTALAALVARGRSTPCQERRGDLWFGPPTQRARAVELCGNCPVLTLCREFGDEVDERWGVLGGVDREAPAARTVHAQAASLQVRARPLVTVTTAGAAVARPGRVRTIARSSHS